MIEYSAPLKQRSKIKNRVTQKTHSLSEKARGKNANRKNDDQIETLIQMIKYYTLLRFMKRIIVE